MAQSFQRYGGKMMAKTQKIIKVCNANNIIQYNIGKQPISISWLMHC